jgi:hypothetical protein
VRIAIMLALLCSTARADGPYVSWGMSAWWGQGASGMLRSGGDATFDLRVGMRVHDTALEAFTSPDVDTLSVTGLDAKWLRPLGRYVSPYLRLRVARMSIDLDGSYDAHGDTPAFHDSRLGVGAAIGIQTQFPAYPFGVLFPAWFAAPAGPKRTGGMFLELGHEYYAPEHVWRFAWGLAWGGAF